MRAHPLPEARATRRLMLEELRKVIPSFLTRVDRPDRGGAWSEYLAETRDDTAELVARHLRGDEPEPARRRSTLTDFDPEGEDKLLAAICYPHTHLPEDQVLDRVRRLADRRARRARCTRTSASGSNRRHKPGRAFERTDYRFDVLADYGAFRDLQRHRMLTIEWQPLSPRHGYDVPDAARRRRPRRARSTTRWSARPRCTTRWSIGFPEQAAVRGLARVPGALRDADERTRGDAPPRAAHRAAGPPAYRRSPGDAPAHRGAGRPPRDRGGDALRRPRRRTSSSASTRSAPPKRRVVRSDARCAAAHSNDVRTHGVKKFVEEFRAVTCVDARRCRSSRRVAA